MPELLRHRQRIRMDLYSIVFLWSLVSLVTFQSEALATSFVSRSLFRSRGGSSTTATNADATIGATWLQSQSQSNSNVNVNVNPNGITNGHTIDNSHHNDHILDQSVDAEFVAETNLPTDLGLFRLRAYRIPPSDNQFVGTEPCVIYAADKPPFGVDGTLAEGVVVRVHDQCLTSEVFRSQRYVQLLGFIHYYYNYYY